jgi:hypothetical protein
MLAPPSTAQYVFHLEHEEQKESTCQPVRPESGRHHQPGSLALAVIREGISIAAIRGFRA